MQFPKWRAVSLLIFLLGTSCFAAPNPATGTRLHYFVLSAKTEAAPPFAVVDFVYGPEEKVSGHPCRWWQFEVRPETNSASLPACVVRCLSSGDPLAETDGRFRILRYQLFIPETSETLEYVDAHSGAALLPSWENFNEWFIPHSTSSSQRQNGAAETATFLGQILSLRSITNGEWTAWPNVKRLVFDREMLIGTGRNFKDAEGHRLPQTPKPQEYTYVKFTGDDYRTMLDAGINLYVIEADQEQFVRDEPVFYVREDVRKQQIHFPADLYRANFLGTGMFMDEPASILTWDKFATPTMRHFSDTAALIEARTRAMYESGDYYYGRHGLEQALEPQFNLGEMRLAATELPVWETHFDRAFYVLKGGGSGIVHEGRYQLSAFNEKVSRATGREAHYTAPEMLRYHYAMLRGGAQPWGKFWGTAIYGQCDTNIAPGALTMAYDMGARYFWFWSSDHGHHVPWPEQLELSRHLTQYAKQHPRRSIFEPPPKRDVAIAIPNGYFISFENLWWLNRFNAERTNAASQEYRKLIQHTLDAVDECFRHKQDFDITVDDGRRISGYGKAMRIRE